MKNPNGYGSVVKLSGKRRNPYWVRKTIGWNDKGHPIYQTIGYTRTRGDGNMMLAEFNKNPYVSNHKDDTLQDIFNFWLEHHSSIYASNTLNMFKSSYKHISFLANERYADLKAFNMQDTISKDYSRGVQACIIKLWRVLDKVAYELDVINKMASISLKTTSKQTESTREPFTEEEISIIWNEYNKTHSEELSIVLLYLYTGFRRNELTDMLKANVLLEEGIMRGGSKTKNGINRVVPIHHRIAPIIEYWMSKDGDYLLSHKGKKFTETTIRLAWLSALTPLGIDKVIHEARHTFETRLDNANGNRKAIDLLLGHKSVDIGNRIYNHKTISQLKDTVELLT